MMETEAGKRNFYYRICLEMAEKLGLDDEAAIMKAHQHIIRYLITDEDAHGAETLVDFVSETVDSSKRLPTKILKLVGVLIGNPNVGVFLPDNELNSVDLHIKASFVEERFGQIISSLASSFQLMERMGYLIYTVPHKNLPKLISALQKIEGETNAAV